VPLAIAIDLEGTEGAVEESEGSLEEPEVAVAVLKAPAAGTAQRISIKEVFRELNQYKMWLNMMEMEKRKLLRNT